MNTMNKTSRQHIRILLILLLLLLGGMSNGAWAKKVTYHILTKPFTVKTYNGNGNIPGRENIRVEALQCTSEETTIGLPDQFKSPLVMTFHYWTSATSTYGSLYDNGHGTKIINTKYYIYDCKTGDDACFNNSGIAEGASVGNYTDIYVTYDYNSNNDIIDLSGNSHYNVALTNSGIQKFMCFNRSRNNRVANALGSGLSGEDLANDDFVIPVNDKKQLGWNWSKWGPIGVFMGFKFIGEDPYNITIMTSYEGKELHITDKITNVDKTGTVKPYAGSTLFSKVGATSLWFDASNNRRYVIESGISDVGKWTEAKYKECYDAYYADGAKQYDIWNGFYRSESPTMNSFALLNNPKGEYMFVGSKMNQGDGNSTKPTINQPNSKNEYYSYLDFYDTDGGGRSQPYFKLQALNSALPINFYAIRTYTVHITPHGYGSPAELTADMKWSDARIDDNPADHVPDVLKRKYVSYTAYSDAAHTQLVTSFKGIQNANNGNNIYLDYTVSESLPFDTITAKGGVYDYKDARWYTIRMDGVANPKYIAYNDGSHNLVVTNGSGAAKGSNTSSQIHDGEASPEAMVAFIGDPYRLRILNRKACETANANKYIGCANGSADNTGLSTNMGTSDISTWEIMYESTGETGMLLREYRTAASANPRYINLGSATNNKPVTYSSDSIRIRVVELEKVKYTYHIVRNNAGDIAVKASDSHDVGKMLRSWTDIPEIIRSPFLNPIIYPSATVTYYGSLADAMGNTNAILNAPYDSNRDIYVRYSVSISEETYNVRLNNDYIYTYAGDDIRNKAKLDEGDAINVAFQWTLDYSDPYHMTIWNKGKEKYVNFAAFSDAASIIWSDTPSYFVAKSGAIAGTYEVMAATGDGTDASSTYYNIGRPSDNTVKLYSNSSYIHGNAVLRFQLIGTSATRVVYHLIDKKGKDLLQATTRQTTTDPTSFPPEYHSPLVSTYHYYIESNFNHDPITDTYTLKPSATEQATVGSHGHIYVTYDVNDLVDLKASQLYLLKYEAGEKFYQEDGSDGRTTEKLKAIYPYVNGDGNFFIYGQEQYDIQQEGAASTRTRWAWYVESNVEGAPKGDPYHVMIKSRQTESYPITNSSEYNAYFMTYKPNGYSEVITTLGWPGMNSETATEYMVLGSEGQYQLVTSNEIGGSRYVVNSFEQYWKTYDTIRRKLLNQPKNDTYPDIDNNIIIVPSTPCEVTGFDDNRTYLTTSTDAATPGLGFHSYEKWAYAKRWNGYNNGYSSTEGKHETKKGWERLEHWYQTVDMGEGYFDFVKTDINPVLILLDQHGWEIMRKPLPTSPDDPNKDAKYAEIRPYNSPMVKEYAFWATAKKRTGFHQYYLLSDRIGGDDYTSTDLTNLPPYGSKNVLDKKGNQNDQYVTYIVKDEYAQTYTPSTTTGKPFLIEQGNHNYATYEGGATPTASAIPHDGDMMVHILNDNIPATEQWYVKPNATIDVEMGYTVGNHSWTNKKEDGSWENKNPNAYDVSDYKDNKTAVYIDQTKKYIDASDDDKKKIKEAYGFFSFSNGFDPYNIQISSVSASSKYMKTTANGAVLHEGSLIGSYPTNPGTIGMGNNATAITPTWYDSRNLAVTNATFMAVQDAAGNMQLMPRFDHTTRMSEFGTLIAPTDNDVAKTYTKLYRPEVYEYLIIDNDGKESLRYKTGGDMTPQTPDHFRSPLATNFTYYATATATTEAGVTTYSEIKNEIKESLDGVTLSGNKIYVRYEYDKEADDMNMLKGNWLTMQLNERNAIYVDGIKQASGDKPATIDGDKKQWQWKFAHNSQPDPYAIYIYNRSQNAGTKAIVDRFAILSHSAGDYALAKAGVGTYTYYFLDGDGMNIETAASVPVAVPVESGFTPTSGTFDGTKSQVKLYNDVTHSFVYKVYTNGGVEAISATQPQENVYSNDWKPVLPEAARTPLLNMDQYRYYEHSLAAGAVVENDTLNKAISLLFGLYDDIVYTHYTAYDPNVSTYMVPNVRNATNVNPVARDGSSNDAPIGLDGKRPYNIIWYQDNMMKSSGTSIISEVDKELQSSAPYEWEFEGDDPYAIKIKSVGESLGSTTKYIHEATTTTTNLSTTATPFMLLNKDGYDYGVFAKTGAATTMLSGSGDVLTTSDPEKFIPFALSTYKVIYHLIIANVCTNEASPAAGQYVDIPYSEKDKDGNWASGYSPSDNKTKRIYGTTLRDLESANTNTGDRYQLGSTINGKTYCYNAGHVSLGDAFEVPQAFYRPNVSYDYYIDGVYNHDTSDEYIGSADTDMNNLYKGLKMTNMGEDSRLLDKIVWVNVVYKFGVLETNTGSGFVTSVSQNKWYTFETSDATPMLAEYSDKLKTVSGYATHYTNDYLWTPVGDPYGFKMYNRYIQKNLRGNQVMSTSEFTPNKAIEMVNDDTSKPYLPTNSVYELLANSSTTPGYFRIHPVANYRVDPQDPQYYIKNDNGELKLNTTPTEWTFGLSEEVMNPYNQAAGYVGGLNTAGKEAYDKVCKDYDDKIITEFTKLTTLQDVVYNHDKADDDADNYIVHYTPGYYRLHSQPGSSGITTPRYMSGYTHKIELTADNGNAIPLHFYEVEQYDVNNPTFKDLGTAVTDYTETAATRGDIPLVTVAKDPASIFRFTGTANSATMSTQGLYVKDNKMTETAGSATPFTIVDIGAGIVALQNGVNFLKYAQTSPKYDLKFDNDNSTVESARWCMKPVQKDTEAGNGEMPLKVTTNYGGDEYYYTTFYAPFDVLLTSTNDEAYIVPSGQWSNTILYPKEIGEYNTAENNCPENYRGNNRFIPAGTPVIIRTKNTGGEVTMALPTTTPSSNVSCVFSGEYLEQMLTQNSSDYVFVFGRSYTHSNEFTYDGGSGIVTPAGLELDKGVGFYKNASNDRESNATKTMWTRNNKYVYANKIYYRAGSSGSGSRQTTRGVEFIPVIFDFEGEEPGDGEDGQQQLEGDNRIYDLQGRCVATEQQVREGSWRNLLAPGIYILNGKKFMHQNHTGWK